MPNTRSRPCDTTPPPPGGRIFDPKEITSVTLLERLRTNDGDAWARLVRLYGPLVAYWVGREGTAGADAEDVVQEVFRQVSQALPGFRRDRPGDTFRGGMRGVTRIALLRYWRAAEHRVVHTLRVTPPKDGLDDCPFRVAATSTLFPCGLIHGPVGGVRSQPSRSA